MTTSKLIRHELLKKIAQPTIYKRIGVVRKKALNSISKEIAIDIVAAQEEIDVHEILKKEGRGNELEEFKNAIAKFDFGINLPKRQLAHQPAEKKDERSPYDTPLAKYDIDSELVRDCKMQKPYRKAVSEALLTLETRIRKKLGLDDTFYGTALISEAKKMGAFDRKVSAEAEGLFMLYMGAIKWLRNPSGHRKIEYSKEDALKIVLFTDHLIQLFENLVDKKICS